MAKGDRCLGTGSKVDDNRKPNSVKEPEHWKAVCNESCMHGLGRGGWKRIRSRFPSLPLHTGTRTPAQDEHLASRLLHLGTCAVVGCGPASGMRGGVGPHRS